MSIHAALLLSILFAGVESPSLTAANNPAAWIAVLRDYENQHGRDAWSYQELADARTAVLDPHYSVKTLPGWLHDLTVVYLRYYPVLLLIIFVIGLRLVWKRSQSYRWGSQLFWLLSWFILMWLVLLPVMTETRPGGVLKSQGTVLREGNGLSYPMVTRDNARISLAAGVEVLVLAKRSNGWVQIQLADGTVGWAPTDSVYLLR
jgi:uncharacterized protein YgiM (DUF1202 family)